MTNQAPLPCSIEQVAKQRNGRPRFWCSVHQANATGRNGARLSKCERAGQSNPSKNILDLDPDDYPGGIALWGAVPLVYDTSGLPPETGAHVHARKEAGMEKEIDATYDAVIVRCSRDDVGEVRALVTSEAAVNYYISRFLGRNVRHLLCPRCGELHLDMDFFAVNVHRRHLCHGCGHYFNDDRRAVSNPIALVRENLSKVIAAAEPQRPDRPLSISQLDYPGGIQIWASNPAIVWTAERPEEEGVHVHAFSSHGVIAFDETFSEATIDGINVDETQVQHFMAQSALPYLAKRVLSLKCPDCGNRHFDRGGVCSSP